MGTLSAFFAFSATGFARLKDFILSILNIRAVLDARMNPTVSLITTDALVCMICSDLFDEQATALPRRNHPLHDLITKVLLRSLQCGIAVMGFIDAFVYAHQHRASVGNPGNFGDCIKGRIHFMTSVSPACAQAYQATCLTRHMPAAPHKNFRLQKTQSRYPHLPNARSTTRESGNDFHEWAIDTDGSTRVVNVETLARWSVIARSPHGRIDIMFGPVITTEAHPAFSVALIDALSFLGPRGPGYGLVYFRL